MSKEAERLARDSYDRLAQEYYTSTHATSRAFDFAISRYLRRHKSRLKPGEFYLDVGSGRSKFYEIEGNGLDLRNIRLVLVDVSPAMLRHSANHLSKCQMVASAFHLPVASAQVWAVFAFLGDPFGTPDFFQEALRVLKTGGELLHISPSYIWATTLRKHLRIPVDRTLFPSREGPILAPSFVSPSETQVSRLKDLGFSDVNCEDLYLPSDFRQSELSEHLTIPSKVLGIDLGSLPILTVMRAIK